MDSGEYNKDMEEAAKLIKKMATDSGKTVEQIINEVKVELNFREMKS